MAFAAHGQVTRMLFLGNSYTGANSLPTLVEQVATSMGDTVDASSNMPGGHTLAMHTTNTTSQALIASTPWDFVVLQEQSQLPSFPQGQVDVEVLPYAAQLVDAIRANDSCTTPVFYMTWGRQNGDQQNCANWPPVCTYAGMYGLLRERYLQMATANTAACAPAGAAWDLVRAMHPGIALYVQDGSHPSLAGSYLVACTMYATCFRRSPVGAFHPTAMHPDTAGILQQAAAQVVLDSLTTWNIGAQDPVADFQWEDLGNGGVRFVPVTAGGAAHTWSFGDGTSSTATEPVHAYAVAGSYDVVHRITDACGRTDSTTVTVTSAATGIANVHRPGLRAWCTEEGFVIDAPCAGMLAILGTDGRLVGSLRTDGAGPLQGPAMHGAVLWRFRGTDGREWSGRVACP